MNAFMRKFQNSLTAPHEEKSAPALTDDVFLHHPLLTVFREFAQQVHQLA